jgi:hypothetical protein
MNQFWSNKCHHLTLKDPMLAGSHEKIHDIIVLQNMNIVQFYLRKIFIALEES